MWGTTVGCGIWLDCARMTITQRCSMDEDVSASAEGEEGGVTAVAAEEGSRLLAAMCGLCQKEEENRRLGKGI